MTQTSSTHVFLIPSYNPGAKVFETVTAARAHWAPLWVVVDGSTDGTGEALRAIADRDPGLRVFTLPRNRGKGAAILHGVREALKEGFTYVPGVMWTSRSCQASDTRCRRTPCP